jgi:hypothetical protein
MFLRNGYEEFSSIALHEIKIKKYIMSILFATTGDPLYQQYIHVSTCDESVVV